MVGSLGVIRPKGEPGAALSTASQSPPRSGSLLAGQDREVGEGKRQVHVPLSVSVAQRFEATEKWECASTGRVDKDSLVHKKLMRDKEAVEEP